MQNSKLLKLVGVLLLFVLFSCSGKSTNGRTILVDVRTKGIWDQGHGKGINIPLPELEKHKAELLKYDTVIFVCESGKSAQQATSYMNSQKNHQTVFKNGVSWTNYQTCP
jgi:rhodanese-related sulfurtransferase